MKRLVKILLAVVGVLALLIVLLMGALLVFFDPNDYKSQIDSAIGHRIGREVDIHGDIGLSVFPWLGLELGRVEIANAPGFGDKPMAAMDHAEISVKLLPLIGRDIEVGTVRLEGLRLRLARNAEGRSNWADIAERLSADQQAAPNDGENESGAPPPADGDGGFDVSSLTVGAIDIQDAAVDWRDANSGAHYRASGVDLSTGRLTGNDPVRVETSGHVAAEGRGIDARFNLIGQIEPDIAQRFYRFSNVKLTVLASGSGVPAKRQQATLAASGNLDMADGRFKLADVALQAAGMHVTGNLDGSGLNGTPEYSGRVTVKPFDPRAVLRELAIAPPATHDDDALSSAAFDAQFNATNDSVDFKQIEATLDDSSLEGSAAVSYPARPRIGFDLGVDTLDLDRYRPPETGDSESTGESKKSPGANGNTDINLSALNAFDMNGKLTVGSLTASSVRANNVKLDVRLRRGKLSVAPLTADLYQGKLRANASVDASGATPRYALDGKLESLHVKPLLADIAVTDKLAAIAGLNIDVHSAGKQISAIKHGLDGRLGFDLRDGAFYGFNLAQLIAAARARLAGGDAGVRSGLGDDDKTPFKRLSATFDVKDGVFRGNDLDLASPRVNATGSGRYDLAANRLDYTLDLAVPDDAKGRLAELSGASIPIELSGDLLSPDYSLDVAGALRSIAGQRLKKEKSKVEDKLRKEIDKRTRDLDSDVGDTVRKGIRGLFGGDKDK